MTAAAKAGATTTDAGDPAPTDLPARLAVAVGRIDRRIRPAGDGLSHGQLSALSTIVRKGPLRPSELARFEVLAAPTVTRVLADLESAGFIEREPDPKDGRSFFVSATDAGGAAILRARSERAQRVAALLEPLDDAELATLTAALDALEAVALAPGTPTPTSTRSA